MNFDEIRDFLLYRMRLSHIYQPLLIKSLIDAGGYATVRQLAMIFVGYDEALLQQYERTLKKMPIKVLRKHEIIETDGMLVSLNVKKLSMLEKAEIKKICDEKIQDYIIKRGLSIWDYRLLDLNPVRDSLRYRLLKESKGKCALCGASNKDTVLDIDHIIPVSKGGKTVYENLQVLCAKCNRSKGNTDNTSFKNYGMDLKDDDCIFCNAVKSGKQIIENELAVALLDNFPVTIDHSLILPKRHISNYFEASGFEHDAFQDLLHIRQREIKEQDRNVSGFNIGINVGESAGQTINHLHIHLIPRRKGDIKNPRGGVRGVIPDKQDY